MKKTTGVFLYIKYSKFRSVSLEHFVEHKPLISEEWPHTWLATIFSYCPEDTFRNASDCVRGGVEKLMILSHHMDTKNVTCVQAKNDTNKESVTIV